jgi:hypothetical protein
MSDTALARKLAYSGPRKLLLMSLALDAPVSLLLTPEAAMRYRRRRNMKFKLHLRQAALMCFGRKCSEPTDSWTLAMWPEEYSPIDTVFRRRKKSGEETYEFVQLKEFVPTDVNPSQSLQELLDDIERKYPSAGRLTIGVHVHRDATTNLAILRYPKLKEGSLWFFSISDGEPPFDSFLIGDMTRDDCTLCSFNHPVFRPGESLLSLKGMED